ncbi:MAG: divergent polysaccharide deacetylase family protein [Gammaproteobacteria bacterium]
MKLKLQTGLLWPVFLGLLLLVATFPQSGFAGDIQQPVIAIIIDDMGTRRSVGKQFIELPGPVAYSFLPHAHYTQSLSKRAHNRDKEILLHLPMESVDHQPLDKGGMVLDMTEQQFSEVFRNNLARVPFAQGVNNHMGSLITRHPGHMQWLMKEIQREGNLYFVDSRTTKATVAHKVAREWGIPTSKRNVFLDNVSNPKAVRQQFRALIKSAKKYGTALAIGHPYRSTLKVLQEQLPVLEQQGVKLVAVSELIQLQQESTTWQASASLSLSPRAAKNLKQ